MRKVAQNIYFRVKKFRFFQSSLQKDCEKIKGLYPGESVENRLEEHYVETIVLLMKIAVAGTLVTAVLGIHYSVIRQENITFIKRNEYGEGNQHVDIVGYGQNGFILESSLIIREREYTEQDLEYLYEDFLPLLEERMLGNNSSLEQINHDLVFPAEISGFPFNIKWYSNDTDVINHRGELAEEYVDSEKQIAITATISCDNFSRKHTWEVTVVPGEWTSESAWKFHVKKALGESDDESKKEQYWKLPTVIEGESIYWQRQEKNRWPEAIGLSLVCMLLVIWGRSNDLKRQIKKRDVALEREYSNIVTKLTLYLGAGMTVKSAWKKTATQIGKKREEMAIREMLLTSREMDSGIYEGICYENFGRRCGRQEYVRLGTLLSQNLKKGNSELLHRLQDEVDQVRERQKHLVRRQGEEASTKLLGPMIILLGITMVLIMIPAFSGIG